MKPLHLHSRSSRSDKILSIGPGDSERVVGHAPTPGETDPFEGLRRCDLEDDGEPFLGRFRNGDTEGDILERGVRGEAAAEIVAVLAVTLSKGCKVMVVSQILY